VARATRENSERLTNPGLLSRAAVARLPQTTWHLARSVGREADGTSHGLTEAGILPFLQKDNKYW